MDQPWKADYEGRDVETGEIVRGHIFVGSNTTPADIDQAFVLARSVFIGKHPHASMTRLVMYPSR
jgi:hypothetical protein